MLKKLIIESLDQGKPPDRVHQRDIARTRDYYDLRTSGSNPTSPNVLIVSHQLKKKTIHERHQRA